MKNIYYLCSQKTTMLEFTEEDLQTLQYERYNHPHPRVMLKTKETASKLL
jgi:hypothetical protein